MGIATSMKELTQDILSSSEDRADGLAKLKKQTSVLRREAKDMVKDFSASHHETSRQLKRRLAQSNADMKKQGMASREEAQNLIKGFQAERKESGTQLRKELAQNERECKKQVQDLMEGFQESRHDASYHLSKELAESKAKIKSEVWEVLADVDALIKDYQSSRRTMGAQLKNDLSKDRVGRKAEVEEMLGDFQKDRAEVRADLNQASDTWREMALTICTEKAGGAELPEVKKETPAGISTDLKEKLFSIINRHNNGGITLSEVADTLGVATVTLSKAARTLQEEGKVRRIGKVYYS